MLYRVPECKPGKNNFFALLFYSSKNEDGQMASLASQGQMWQCMKFYFWHFDETYSYINIVRSINSLDKCIFYDYM